MRVILTSALIALAVAGIVAGQQGPSQPSPAETKCGFASLLAMTPRPDNLDLYFDTPALFIVNRITNSSEYDNLTAPLIARGFRSDRP